MTAPALDTEFADLQPWAEAWAIRTEAERLAARAGADYAQLHAFYDALAPRMDAIIEHLNATPMPRFSPAQRSLFHLAQSFFEASLSVELLREPDEAEMITPARVRIDIEGGLG